jgi:hypothetical protein
MEKSEFKISFMTVRMLVLSSFIVSTFAAITNLQGMQNSELLIEFSRILFFATWFIVLNDMIISKIYNKKLWLVMMFIMPFLYIVFYMFQRDKLIRMGQKFG